jgi:hypothetical protein
MQGRVGEGAPVRASEVHAGRDRAVELIPDEYPVTDEVEGLPGHPFAVDGDRGQPVLDRAIAGHVHHGGAVLQRTQLVEGGERRAGVGGLVAHRPVELRGVTDRLVDREPQIRWIDHEVVDARLD